MCALAHRWLAIGCFPPKSRLPPITPSTVLVVVVRHHHISEQREATPLLFLFVLFSPHHFR